MDQYIESYDGIGDKTQNSNIVYPIILLIMMCMYFDGGEEIKGSEKMAYLQVNH